MTQSTKKQVHPILAILITYSMGLIVGLAGIVAIQSGFVALVLNRTLIFFLLLATMAVAGGPTIFEFKEKVDAVAEISIALGLLSVFWFRFGFSLDLIGLAFLYGAIAYITYRIKS